MARLSAPCWVQTTWYYCGLQPSAGTKVVVMGKMGDIFFQLLHSDLFAKHWYYDDEGFESCTLRYPIVERFRKWEA